ncbi:hypothetical protein ASD64_14725 [Mesorhizobium sp. Root157]|uniref:hypothetical protein n=1 Tax=Mesorhizobium sp. Root157 TaxID=1736477 RepID=UPI0006F5EB7F|nr:hypothetical protein [Mesorhizobium sp. Root157]KQZ99582.1 hypothetical protein ASD64_14725 [Mesorhizobium sp. Root157]
MNAHTKPDAPAKSFDMESATAELCSLVLAIGQLQSEPSMKDVCGFLLNIANRTAREIEAAR